MLDARMTALHYEPPLWNDAAKLRDARNRRVPWMELARRNYAKGLYY